MCSTSWCFKIIIKWLILKKVKKDKEALYNKNKNQPAKNFLTVLEYLRDSFIDSKIVDPANTNNIISDELYKYEKEAIAKKAKESLDQTNWGQIIW